jgi:hypothetical protein
MRDGGSGGGGMDVHYKGDFLFAGWLSYCRNVGMQISSIWVEMAVPKDGSTEGSTEGSTKHGKS